MSDEKKQCVTCGKNLREGSPFPTCGKHRTQDEQREQWRLAEERKRRKNGAAPRAPKADSDDRVLAGIGMKPPPASVRTGLAEAVLPARRSARAEPRADGHAVLPRLGGRDAEQSARPGHREAGDAGR